MSKLNNMLCVTFLLANYMVTVMTHLHRAETDGQYSSLFQKILNSMQTKVEEASVQPTALEREKLATVSLLIQEMSKLLENSRAIDKTSDYWYMRPG